MAVNKRAVAKAVVVAIVMVLGILANFPVTHLTVEYLKDVSLFAQNKTVWHSIPQQGRLIYILAPIGIGLLLAAWLVLVTRSHRKGLLVNGIHEGRVMWIYGLERTGHLYDAMCLCYNRGRHFERWQDSPRPISGDFAKNLIVIYYRPGWFHSPLSWYRVMCDPDTIKVFRYRVVLTGQYQKRIIDLKCPDMVYFRLSNQIGIDLRKLNLSTFLEERKLTQDNILTNTWRMGRAETNTAAAILRKSSYAMSDKTLSTAWDALSQKERERIEAIWKGGGNVNGGKTDTEAEPASN